jgi:hypothetical protein
MATLELTKDNFNEVTTALGQQLFYPPTVAGWAHGRSWITPGLLLARGNFVYDVLFPDISFIPHDRYPRDETIRKVSTRLAQGLDLTSATMPDGDGTIVRLTHRDLPQEARDIHARGWSHYLSRLAGAAPGGDPGPDPLGVEGASLE